MNFTVSHVGLRTSQVDSVKQEGPLTEFNFATKRFVAIAVTDIDGPTDVQQVKDFFSWPTWPAPYIPPTSEEWAAVFNTKTKAFEGLYGSTAAGELSVAIRCAQASRITDAMWEMVQGSGCVLLCTGLSGDPTAAEFGAAAGNRKLQAVLAQAVFD
ncbi:hypothetical protein ABZO31_33965 [Streptomyces sp. HUAS MG47]|uniref:hypothetical protein n=1 Tax=Streptomyces solicamelliae TaxID=3231716 RepID=UPI0038778FF7